MGPFRVCFGSVSGPFWGVGWGRGGVGERGFCGRVRQGRFVIFALPLFCSVWGSQDTQMLGNTARKMPLSHPFLGAPNASKN